MDILDFYIELQYKYILNNNNIQHNFILYFNISLSGQCFFYLYIPHSDTKNNYQRIITHEQNKRSIKTTRKNANLAC